MPPVDLLYAKTHEWCRLANGPAGERTATIGITAFAIEALTDLVHIELPKVGTQLKAGRPFGEIESVKAVSDLYSPVDGEVVEVNNKIIKDVERLNQDAYDQGWLIRVQLSSESGLSELMDEAHYQKQCAEEGH